MEIYYTSSHFCKLCEEFSSNIAHWKLYFPSLIYVTFNFLMLRTEYVKYNSIDKITIISIFFIWFSYFVHTHFSRNRETNAHYILQVMVLFAIVFYENLKYNGHYEYPGWALAFGWLLTFSSLIWIPGYIIYKFFSYPGNFKEVCSSEWSNQSKRFFLQTHSIVLHILINIYIYIYMHEYLDDY